MPGSAKESLLVQVLGKDSKPHMPPEGQLSREDIMVIAEWVDGLDPATLVGGSRITAEDREHWAFQPVQKISPPDVVNTDWPETPIDRFVLARLEAANLQPSSPANKATLLRRVSFALIGLPPSPVKTLLRFSPTRRLTLTNELSTGYWRLRITVVGDGTGSTRSLRRLGRLSQRPRSAARVAVPRLRHRQLQRRQAVRAVRHRAARRRSTAGAEA